MGSMTYHLHRWLLAGLIRRYLAQGHCYRAYGLPCRVRFVNSVWSDWLNTWCSSALTRR
jgi:hypothetical protein